MGCRGFNLRAVGRPSNVQCIFVELSENGLYVPQNYTIIRCVATVLLL